MFEDEITEETTEETEGANEGAEGEESETPETEQVEYQLDEDGEPILDEDGNPVPVVAEGDKEEAEKGKPDHKKGAQDRIQQLANEKRELAARLARLEAQFNKQQEEKPDFIEPDMDKVNAWLQNTYDQIEEYRLAGDYLAVEKLQRAKDKLISDLEENDKKRTAYMERQGKSKTAESEQVQFLNSLKSAEEMYREEMGIDPDIWTKQGEWFAAELGKSKVLVKEFSDLGKKSPISAIRFAHEYTLKNMGIDAQKTKDTKNQNKNTASALSRGPSGKVQTIDLDKALERAKELGTDEGWVEYQALKRRAKGR